MIVRYRRQHNFVKLCNCMTAVAHTHTTDSCSHSPNNLIIVKNLKMYSVLTERRWRCPLCRMVECARCIQWNRLLSLSCINAHRSVSLLRNGDDNAQWKWTFGWCWVLATEPSRTKPMVLCYVFFCTHTFSITCLKSGRYKPGQNENHQLIFFKTIIRLDLFYFWRWFRPKSNGGSTLIVNNDENNN